MVFLGVCTQCTPSGSSEGAIGGSSCQYTPSVYLGVDTGWVLILVCPQWVLTVYTQGLRTTECAPSVFSLGCCGPSSLRDLIQAPIWDWDGAPTKKPGPTLVPTQPVPTLAPEAARVPKQVLITATRLDQA